MLLLLPTARLRRHRFLLLWTLLVPAGMVASGCLPVVAAAVVGLLEVLDGASGDANSPPSVIIEEIVRDGTASQVSFDLRAIDADGDTLSLDVHYSREGGPWQAASVSPTTVPASSGGLVTTLSWDAASDLGSSEFQDELQLRVVPFDGEDTGAPAVSNEFAFGNSTPSIDSVELDMTEGVVTGTAIVRIVVSDVGSDPVDLSGFELSLSGDFQTDSTEIAITTDSGGNFPVGAITELATNASGIEHTFGWNTFLSAQVYSENARVRVRVTDTHGAESDWGESDEFVVVNQDAPFVRIVDVKEPQPGGLRSGAVPIVLRLEDDESDVVDLDVQFSTDGETWYPCTEFRGPLSAGRRDVNTREASAQGLDQVFVWDSSSDLFAYQQAVRLRVRAHDGWQPSLYYEYPVPIQVGPAAAVEPFAELQVVQSSPIPLCGVVADFNGNGIDDIAVGGPLNNEVRVFLGAPDGLPVSSFSDSMAAEPRTLVAADFTGNGHNDFVVRSQQDVTLFPGNGDGTFGTPSGFAFPSGGYTHSTIAYADFNGNGSLDLAVNDFNVVEVWFNNGSGGFDPQDTRTVTLDGDPKVVRGGDVTGNGHADLVILAWNTVVDFSSEDVVQIFEGGGDGTFASEPIILFPGPWLNELDLADLTGNGLADIVVSTWVSRAQIYVNEGSAQFHDHGSISMGIARPDLGRILAADISGNGIDDVIVYTEEEIAVRISLGADVDKTLGFLTPFSGPNKLFLHSVLVGDFDGNGLSDFAVMSEYGLEVQYAHGRQTPFSDSFEVPILGTGNALAVGDLNRNGGNDIVIAQRYQASVNDDLLEVHTAEVRGGVPTGRFTVTDTLTIPYEPKNIALADVTGNGWLDIVLTCTFPAIFAVVPNSENGLGAVEEMPLSNFAETMAIGDVTGNGALDVVLATGDASGTIEILFNNGSGVFSSTLFSADEMVLDVALADLDGDGTLDLVYRILDDEDSLRVRLGDGFGDFGPSQIVPAPFVPLGLELADVSGNGHVDLISWGTDSGTNDRLLAVFEGNGDASFASEVITVLPEFAGDAIVSVALGDLSHNGLLDIAIGGDSGFVHLRYNDGELGFAPATSPAAANQVLQGDFPINLQLIDLSGDGLLDLIWSELDLSRAVIHFGTAPIYTPFATDPLTSAQTLGDDVLVESPNRFGVTFNENRLINRRFGGLTAHGPVPPELGHLRTNIGFAELLRDTSGLAVPPELVPITAATYLDGATRLKRIVDPDQVTDTRLRLGNRFGARVQPESSTNMARLGLDMSSTVASEQRAVIVEVPIDESVDPAEIAAGTVRVFMRITDWTRAEEYASDPLFGSSDGASLLPRMLDEDAVYRDVLLPRWDWIELTEDSSGDLSDPDGQSGPRFLVDQSATPPIIRIATDRLGAIQAFLDED